MSRFGALGGQAQTLDDGTRVWIQNAGFVWVPLIMIGTLAAWFGMNDILSAKSSFADQAAIFGGVHTWLMCWLYTGTFRSEEHTSELQSLMRISYAVFCLKKKNNKKYPKVYT